MPYRGHGAGQNPSATTADDRDYALILDTQAYGPIFDGWALYGEHARPRDCEISAPVKLLGATALRGYDDRVIRNPGNHVDRDDGRYFRRSFESALAAAPDFLSICTWSEWGEGTIIDPTDEFGYQYCEIALTYSLIFRGLMSCDSSPSAALLTVERYDPEGPDGVRLSCKRPVTVRLSELRGLGGATDADGTAVCRGVRRVYTCARASPGSVGVSETQQSPRPCRSRALIWTVSWSKWLPD